MEFATNNMTNFPSHMLTDSLPTPIWNFMEDLIDTKAEAVNEFDHAFFHEVLNQSDSENDSVHNGTTEHAEFHSSVSEDETSMNYPITQAMGAQACFANGILPQSVSMAPCYEMLPNRFDWTNFDQPSLGNALSSLPLEHQTTPHSSQTISQRRSSLPGNVLGNLPDFPNLDNGRKRVFSWGDLDSTSSVPTELDLSQSMRRSSVNIPLHDVKNTFIDALHQNKASADDDELNHHNNTSFTFESGFHMDQNKASQESNSSKKISKGKVAPELQQNVVEKRLNRRRERNRLAARRSREKRTQFLRDLEGINQALRNENCALKAKLCDVLQELEVLRAATSQH